MKHTPAPWKAGNVTRTKDAAREVYTFSKHDPNATIATVHDNGDYNECEANARLIAAAPDLLAALQDCLKIVDRYRATHLGDGDITAANARAAIEKAKG